MRTVSHAVMTRLYFSAPGEQILRLMRRGRSAAAYVQQLQLRISSKHLWRAKSVMQLTFSLLPIEAFGMEMVKRQKCGAN
jgi:hypothetical protein